MSRNLHQFYYQQYFEGINWKNPKDPNTLRVIKSHNATLTGRELLADIPFTDKPFRKSFQLKVLYPGLVTGIGITHEGQIEGEFKLGMHFDWTYGMPVVYGSSVKGVLRSYFKDFYVPNDNQPDITVTFDDIFNGTGKSIYNRDIFFDAVIVAPDNKGRILCSDSITPHGDNPLKNPVPITFLKIAPGCTLEFRFKLTDTEMGNKKLTADDKLALFREILTTVGIGAKTNVGYGQLKAAQ